MAGAGIFAIALFCSYVVCCFFLEFIIMVLNKTRGRMYITEKSFKNKVGVSTL